MAPSESAGCGGGRTRNAVQAGIDRPALLNSVGAALHRTGRTEQAIKLLEESVHGPVKGSYVEDWLFLALAHCKLGPSDKANHYLDRATKEIKQTKVGSKLSDGRTLVWRLRQELEVLHQEAHSALEQKRR